MGNRLPSKNFCWFRGSVGKFYALKCPRNDFDQWSGMPTRGQISKRSRMAYKRFLRVARYVIVVLQSKSFLGDLLSSGEQSATSWQAFRQHKRPVPLRLASCAMGLCQLPVNACLRLNVELKSRRSLCNSACCFSSVAF